MDIDPSTPLRFRKKLGNHRGNPRIFFETTDIQPFGFVPGARYHMDLRSPAHLELKPTLLGKRTVVKRVKGPHTLSVIDINSQVLEGFRGEAEVLVTVTTNQITITKLSKE